MQKIKNLSLILIVLINFSCSGYLFKRHYLKGYTFLKINNQNQKSNYNHVLSSLIKNKIISEDSFGLSVCNSVSINKNPVNKKIYNNILNNNFNDCQLNYKPKKNLRNFTLNKTINFENKTSETNKSQDENNSTDNKSILYKNLKFNLYLFLFSILFYLLLYFTSMNFFNFLLYALIILFLIIIFINFIYNTIKYFTKFKEIENEKRFFIRFVLYNLLILFLLILFINGLYFGFGFFGYLYFF